MADTEEGELTHKTAVMRDEETQVNGEVVRGVHEALDLKRYGQPLLKPMLAMRVPRRTKWKF